MKLRPYIPEKDFDMIKNWITDPRTHALWCGNRFEYPLSGENFNETLKGFTIRRGDAPFVAVGDDGTATGFFSYSLRPETNEGLLAFVVVDPARRGQGLGKAMLRLALDYAFGISKADAVYLRVFGVNTQAVKCYETIGFTLEKAEPNAFAYENESWERRSMVYRRAGSEPLEQQITLPELKKEHLDNLISLACEIKTTGVKTNMDFSAFDTKKMDEYTAKAKEAWGDTPAYREYEQKAKGRSKAETMEISRQMMDIFGEFGAIRNGDPAAPEARALVRKLQDFISVHYYTCTDQILSGLGQMYAAGGEMTRNIDSRGGEGTAVFASEAIRVFCAG